MRKTLGLIILVLVAEVLLFSASFNKYFCGDSLYFFSHALTSPSQLVHSFTHLDDLSTYRPLPTALFSFVLAPLFGFNPRPFHVFALVGHILTTLVVFLLLRRLTKSENAALAGMLFFGTQAVGFYLSYDATFLPDFVSGLMAAASFAAFAYGRRKLSIVAFVLALLGKESAVMIPVGIAAIALMQARDEQRDWRTTLRPLMPHAVLAMVFLLFQFYLHAGWLYPSKQSAYRFNVESSRLLLKLKYLPWALNLPSDWFRQGRAMLLPIALMTPVLLWIFYRIWKSRREAGWDLAICTVWAIAALLPAIPVAQVPMKHNLYVPVMALAVAIARMLDREQLTRAFSLVAALFIAATTLQVHSDLKTSWVGEGSDVTEASLLAVQRAYPVLQSGAGIYILPTKIPGGMSWYFDDESLFRRVYNDPSLHVYYHSLNRLPPPGFERLSSILVFQFYRGRLYDVTVPYKTARLNTGAIALLPNVARSPIESGLPWTPAELVDGKAASVEPHPLGDSLRDSLVVLPKTTVRIPVDQPIPADAVLLIGAGRVGKQSNLAQGRLLWTDPEMPVPLEIARVAIDRGPGSELWQDYAYDLTDRYRQTGTLIIENTGAADADWIAWSRLRIVPKALAPREIENGAASLRDRGYSLFPGFSAAKIESGISWSKTELPGGQPASIALQGSSEFQRASLVVLPRTTVRIPVAAHLPSNGVLLIGVGRVGKHKNGAQGRLLWAMAGTNEERELARVVIDPDAGAEQWRDAALDISGLFGQIGTFIFQNTGSADSDWIAWNRLAIVGKATHSPAVEQGSQPLRQSDFPLLPDFANARVESTIPWLPAEMPGDRPAGMHGLERGGEIHQAMLVLPQTNVGFPLSVTSPRRLRFAVSTVNGPSAAAIDFVSGSKSETLFNLYLDSNYDDGRWWHGEVDLSKVQGQTGAIVFRNLAERTGGTTAWSSLDLVTDSSSAAAGYRISDRPKSLIDLIPSAAQSFDRSEVYPNYEKFDSPTGKPVFLWWNCPARPARLSLVTFAGARMEFKLDSLPDHSRLSFGLAHGTGVGDGVEARVYWNRQLLYDRLIVPKRLRLAFLGDARSWRDESIELPGGAGTLTLEASSGPKHNTIGDWLAWSALRIEK